MKSAAKKSRKKPVKRKPLPISLEEFDRLAEEGLDEPYAKYFYPATEADVQRALERSKTR